VREAALRFRAGGLFCWRDGVVDAVWPNWLATSGMVVAYDRGVHDFAFQTGSSTVSGAADVLELRQYTVRSGMRERLPALFRDHFIAAQEAAGARILGTFFDLDDPDRFVWLRGYPDMAARGRALAAFYGSDVWKQHRAAANAAIVDSDNALLLHAVPGTAFADSVPANGILRVSVRALSGVDSSAFARWFGERVVPWVTGCGGRVDARYVSEREPNNFEALPVRDDAVFVWFARFPDARAERTFGRALAAKSGWRDDCPEEILPALMRKPEVLRLVASAAP
jgi:NIPSNAP